MTLPPHIKTLNEIEWFVPPVLGWCRDRDVPLFCLKPLSHDPADPVFLQFIVLSDFPLTLRYLFGSGMRVFERHFTMSTIARKLWGLYRADHGSHIHQDDGRTERCDGLLSEAGILEGFIVGIEAGLAVGIDVRDCAFYF